MMRIYTLLYTLSGYTDISRILVTFISVFIFLWLCKLLSHIEPSNKLKLDLLSWTTFLFLFFNLKKSLMFSFAHFLCISGYISPQPYHLRKKSPQTDFLIIKLHIFCKFFFLLRHVSKIFSVLFLQPGLGCSTLD